MTSEGPSSKKPKLASDASKSEKTVLISSLEEERKKAADSILDYKFNKKRVKILSSAEDVPDWAEGVVYWMFRDERVQGLEEVESECKSLNIEYHMLIGNGEEVLPGFIEKNKIGAVVIDFMPLRDCLSWAQQLKKSLPKDVPLCQVDAHNVVPCWQASDKQEYGARTIRGKITRQLPEFLTQFPPVIKHPFSGKLKADKIDWEAAEKTLQVDRSVGPVASIVAGYKAGVSTLQEFCNKRIKLFGSKRNDPTVDALSNLSPYFHFDALLKPVEEELEKLPQVICKKAKEPPNL